MNLESGDFIYAVIVLSVAVLSHRIVRSVNSGLLFKVIVIVGAYVLLRDFYHTYGWQLDAVQSDLWQVVSPELSVTVGVVTAMFLILRDRYMPMLSEAGIMVWNMQRKAEKDLDRQRRDIEADLLRQRREHDAALERDAEEAREHIKREADATREDLDRIMRETRERLKREREEAEKGKAQPRDPYEILALSRDASPAEIKKRYRELMTQYHPDKAAQTTPEIQKLAEERVKEINWAYELLRTGK